MKTKYCFKNEESKNLFRNAMKANEYITSNIDRNGGYFTLLDYDKFDDLNTISYCIKFDNINDDKDRVPGEEELRINPDEIQFFEPVEVKSNDLLSPGTQVKIINGMYSGASGKILSNVWSKRDGNKYRIALDNSEKIVTISVYYVQSTDNIEKEKLENCIKQYEGKPVLIDSVSIINAIDLDEKRDVLNQVRKFEYKHNSWFKIALCTLVFEEDGQIFANVVWQGTYAVVPVEYIETTGINPVKI